MISQKWSKLIRSLQQKKYRKAEQLFFVEGEKSVLELLHSSWKVRAVFGTEQFLQQHQIALYSEHLSYCSGNGHLYDLMPIPFTEEAVSYVARRVRQVQDILEQPLILENVSYYAAPGQQMSEADFTRAVLQEADCQLLLDVNNIYVNSVNHGYNASEFLQAMPSERIAYYHIAGHFKEAEDLLVDTHGSAVIDPVWQLLQQAYQYHGVKPTLLERDFNIPQLSVLSEELQKIKRSQQLALADALQLRA